MDNAGTVEVSESGENLASAGSDGFLVKTPAASLDFIGEGASSGVLQEEVVEKDSSGSGGDIEAKGGDDSR